MPVPVVDVVAVTFNSADHIEGFLDSLPAAAGGLAYRTAVVDNGSTDATVDLVAARDDCVLVRAENLGYGAGLNRGAAELAGSGPLVLTNPDVRLAPGAIAALVGALGHPRGLAVPRLLEEDGSVAHSLRREPTVLRTLGLSRTGSPRLAETVTDPADYATAHEVDWATGAVLAVDRRCYEELGGLDESFFMYSEETDLCLRAGDAGWSTWYTPEAVATHAGGGSGRNPDLYAMQVLNRVRLYRRRHTLPASIAFLGFTLLRETRHAASGDIDARRACEAVLVPRRRPRLLPWRGSPLRSSRPSGTSR